MKLRIAVLILACLFIIPMIAACGSTTDTPTKETTKETVPGSSGNETGPSGSGETESETEIWYEPELGGETPFEGKTFTFFAFTDDTSYYWNDTDFTAEGINGDSLNDAVFERNKYVEERSGATLIIAHAGTNNEYSALTNSVSSGEDAFQAADLNTLAMFSTATNEYLAELNDLGTIQLDAPWWDQNCQSQMSILGQTYGLYGDIGVMYMRTFGIVMFNKKLVADHLDGIDLYEVQDNKEWTIEYMTDLVSTISEDLDGDDKMTEADLFGMVYQGDMMPVAMICAGVEFATKNQEDVPEINFKNEHTLDTIDLLADLMYDTNCARCSSASNPPPFDHHNAFQNDHAIFDVTEIHAVIDARPMETNFGVLCMPLFDEYQANYLTCINPHVAATLVVPNSIQEPDFVGTMLDLLSATGKNYMSEAFYDITLQGKSVRDEQSKATLDLCIASVRYDLGYVADWGVSAVMRQMCDTRSKDFASRYDTNISSFNYNLEKTLDAFRTMQ